MLVELKARFDEESNIEWARALEPRASTSSTGCVGLKTHCKIALVVRTRGRRHPPLRPPRHRQLQRRQRRTCYTDLGLFTADAEIGADATDLFNYLTGYSAQDRLPQAAGGADQPARAVRGADRARDRAASGNGGGGHLIFKMNALVDPAIIRLLYQASQAGVQIDLIVRGICCLRPGVPGVSENIRVISIVGRFLEHSRIYYFRNGGEEEVYLGSADLMPRNLDRRVEVLASDRGRKLR